VAALQAAAYLFPAGQLQIATCNASQIRLQG